MAVQVHLRKQAVAKPAENAAILCAEIERWRQSGLITPETAERLRAQYEPSDGAVPRAPAVPEERWTSYRIALTPGLALLLVGGLLVVCAGIMLAAHAWDDLGPVGQMLLVLAPTILLYGAGGALYHRAPGQRVAATLMLFFACVLAPFALWLAGVALAGEPQESAAIAQRSLLIAILTLAVHLGTLYAFPSPPLTIPYPLTFFWVVMQSLEALIPGYSQNKEQTIAIAVMVAGLLLSAIGCALAARGKPAYAMMPNLVGAFMALGALSVLGADGHQPVWETLAVLASLGAIALSCWRRQSSYLFAGALFLILNIFGIGFEYFADTAGLPMTLLICGAMTMAAGYGVLRVRRNLTGEE